MNLFFSIFHLPVNAQWDAGEYRYLLDSAAVNPQWIQVSSANEIEFTVFRPVSAEYDSGEKSFSRIKGHALNR